MSEAGQVFNDRAKPLGNYPHVKRVGDFLYVSGTSSRKPDNTHEGAEIQPDGTVIMDIRVQTAAVLRNIDAVLKKVGSGLEDVIDITTFLVDMKDFPGYNETYATFFDHTGPSRTTVAVHQLPHPNINIEVKAVAYKPL
ncbi:MAG: RidA family protein [Bacteroidota bacterium]